MSITHPEEENSRPDRNPGIISNHMEETHHVKIQTTHNIGHPSLHPKEHDIMNIDLGKDQNLKRMVRAVNKIKGVLV